MGLFGRTSRQIGGDAENLACHYLQQQGMTLLERNYHSRLGEVDLIMQDHESLVFVEVRYRQQNQYGSAEDSVTRHKQDKLIKTALYYLQHHPQRAEQPSRFDVVAINGCGTKAEIDWIKNAFLAH